MSISKSSRSLGSKTLAFSYPSTSSFFTVRAAPPVNIRRLTQHTCSKPAARTTHIVASQALNGDFIDPSNKVNNGIP